MPSPKRPRGPDGLNVSGNGRGIGLATKPIRKKRGASANTAVTGLEARARGIDTSTYEGAMQISPDKPLTEMQKKFVRLWASGETIPAASAKAGYCDGAAYAYRLVRMPNVLALYDVEKRLYEEAAGMSRKKVMDMLIESYDVAKMLSEPASMVSAAREIGRMCGYYEPVRVKHEVSVEGKVLVERVNALSDEQLIEMIAASSAAIAAADAQEIEHDETSDAG